VATIQDVAKYAGVSISTVSRVLNGRGRVNAEVVANVQAAIQALHYTPNRAARSLRTQQSRIIGLLISDIQNPFFAVLIRGIEDVAQRNGYSLILCNSDENEQKEQQYIDVLCAEHIAGAIIVPTHENLRSVRIFQDYDIPVVAVDRKVQNVDAVLVDNKRGACEAVTHLLNNGYKRIGIITGRINSTTGRERLEGYYQALREAGIEPDPALVRAGSFKTESARVLAHELLAVQPGIDALFVTNNLMTLGALEALHERNLQVPFDIGLVGFDEMPWATLGPISLTTVTQPVYEIGSTAAMRLFQRMQNPDAFTNQEIVLAPTLKIRGSSAPRLSDTQNHSESLLS
jgi:DNA-binding LacI/PurR family transcriptional regulator